MARMSEGFKNRIRDAKHQTGRTPMPKAYGEPWEVWIDRLRFQAELEDARSRAKRRARGSTTP